MSRKISANGTNRTNLNPLPVYDWVKLQVYKFTIWAAVHFQDMYPGKAENINKLNDMLSKGTRTCTMTHKSVKESPTNLQQQNLASLL